MARPAATATTPTSAPGSSRFRPGQGLRRGRRAAGGFTLIELMIVIALIAVAAGVVSLALRDPASARLETEAQRLSALLESARASSRVSGVTVHWLPMTEEVETDFRFVSISGGRTVLMKMPTRWLEPAVRAEVIGAKSVQLGPEPLIGAQRIVLRLADRSLVLGTDGLGPFAVTVDEARP
jgi:general secretion pathway protein H